MVAKEVSAVESQVRDGRMPRGLSVLIVAVVSLAAVLELVLGIVAVS